MNLTKAQKVMGAIATAVGLTLSVWGLFSKIDSKLEEIKEKDKIEMKAYIKTIADSSIAEYYSKKKGSLSADLSVELNVPRENVAETIGGMYNWVDSLGLWYVSIYPMLIEEKHTIDVGIKYDKTTNHIYYLHTNGKKYNPYYDTAHDTYYFMNSNGLREACK